MGGIVKEQVLSPGDRDALQGLLSVAVGLGVATLFASFFARSRRKSGTAVFEVFVIVAVFTIVALSATVCVAVLHQGSAITNDDLTATATPLGVAAFVLVVTMAFSRVPGSPTEALVFFSVALIISWLAARLAISVWVTPAGNMSLMAALIVGSGALLGGCASGLDRLHKGWARRDRVKELVRFGTLGYSRAELALRVGLPRRPGDESDTLVICWLRRGHAFLDLEGCEHLRKEVNQRWQAFSSGEGRPALGSEILTEVQIEGRIPVGGKKLTVRLVTLDKGRRQVCKLMRNDDRLFNVTEFLRDPTRQRPFQA
jgi:hypothetical protein